MSLKSALKKMFKPTKNKIVGVAAFILLTAGISTSVLSTASASASCPGYDNNANAVIYCGAPTMSVLSTDYSKHTQNIQKVYASSPFNMDETSFNDFVKHYQMGYVYKNGDVYVDNQLVATNALTAGHDVTPGCGNQTENSASVFVRPPVCSFKSSPLEAYVYMPNNQFRFAVLNACGNPVVGTPVKPATPTPKPKPLVPNYTITKSVSYQGKGWVHEVTAPVGGVVQYKIEIKSTGSAPVTHVFVNDAISANIQYLPNTLKLNGNPVGDVSAKDFFTKGLQIAALKPGDSTEISFNAKVGVLYTNDNCKPGPYINNAFVNATGLPQKGANAYVQEKCTPPSTSLECDTLTGTAGAIENNSEDFDFTATATPNNTTITKYVFTSGIKNAKPVTVTTSKSTASTSFSYPYPIQSQGYSASVVVYAKMGSSQTSASCEYQVPPTTVTQTCTSPSGVTYPEGSAQCSPGGSTTTCTPSASNSCTTSALPNTGPGNVVAVAVGATGLGALGHWFYLYRKAKRALLK